MDIILCCSWRLLWRCIVKYKIYGKHKTDKRFKPLGTKGFEVNLIHVVHYDKRELAMIKLKELTEDNKDYNFEIRG